MIPASMTTPSNNATLWQCAPAYCQLLALAAAWFVAPAHVALGPELAIDAHSPIIHQPYFRGERELFGHDPLFTPNTVTFDKFNTPYIAVGVEGGNDIVHPVSDLCRAIFAASAKRPIISPFRHISVSPSRSSSSFVTPWWASDY